MAVIAATKDRTEYGRVLKWCEDHGLCGVLRSTDEAEVLVLQLRLSGRDTRLVQFAVEVANLDRWMVWVRDSAEETSAAHRKGMAFRPQ